MQSHRAAFESLARRVRVLERGTDRPERPPLATGWPGADRLLARGAVESAGPAGGLARGAVHEWLGLDGPRLPDSSARGRATAQRTRGGAAAWTPPLFLLAHLARRALVDAASAGDGGEQWVLWVGRRVWPYPRTLTRGSGLTECAPEVVESEASERGAATPSEGARLELELADVARTPRRADDDRSLLDHSLFVDPPDRKGLLWAVDAALRCPSVAAVVADGSNLTMPASRRLQLAAEAGSGLCLLAKPPDEIGQLSAAATRWRVRRGSLPATYRMVDDEELSIDLERDPLDGDDAFGGGDRDAFGGGDRDAFGGGDRPRWELELLRCKAGFARVEARQRTASRVRSGAEG